MSAPLSPFDNLTALVGTALHRRIQERPGLPATAGRPSAVRNPSRRRLPLTKGAPDDPSSRAAKIVAQAVLYAVILAFDFSWIYLATTAAPRPRVLAFLTEGRFAWVWAVTVVLGIVALWQRRRLDRELRNLTTLQQQIAGTRGQADAAGCYAA